MMNSEDFGRVIDVNLVGAFNMIRHCCAGFIRQRGGRIINISSVSGIMEMRTGKLFRFESRTYRTDKSRRP